MYSVLFFFGTERCVVQCVAWEPFTAASGCLARCVVLGNSGHPLVQEPFFHPHLGYSPTAKSWEQFVTIWWKDNSEVFGFFLPMGRREPFERALLCIPLKKGLLQMVLTGWTAPWIQVGGGAGCLYAGSAPCVLLVGGGRRGAELSALLAPQGPLMHLLLVLPRAAHSGAGWKGPASTEEGWTPSF